MTATANTPHTITNARMICFSSEMNIARSPTTPVLRPTGVVGERAAFGVGGETHARTY
jgi:hypothetical protein